ncbi:MAG: GIY-YIG nuclease family protein [Kiritimatiellae bacterium]|nr:GIY-YIG nuclease family protein [Kiritimatiellia bacterium]
MYYLYILLCSDNSYYIGVSKNPTERAQAHNTEATVAYTWTRRPVTLVYTEEHPSLSSARRREHQLKNWSHAKKGALVKRDRTRLKRLARSRERAVQPQ